MFSCLLIIPSNISVCLFVREIHFIVWVSVENVLIIFIVRCFWFQVPCSVSIVRFFCICDSDASIFENFKTAQYWRFIRKMLLLSQTQSFFIVVDSIVFWQPMIFQNNFFYFAVIQHPYRAIWFVQNINHHLAAHFRSTNSKWDQSIVAHQRNTAPHILYSRLYGQICLQLNRFLVGIFVVQPWIDIFNKWCFGDARTNQYEIDAPNVVVILMAQTACVTRNCMFCGNVNWFWKNTVKPNSGWNVADNSATAIIRLAHVLACNFSSID